MTLRMTTLRRASNGDWLTRKAIPADVREAYRAAHGVSREERFRRDASMAPERVKQELREWDAIISGRINSIRAVSNGEGQSLTQREAHALADAPQHCEQTCEVAMGPLGLRLYGLAPGRSHAVTGACSEARWFMGPAHYA
jgi:hypothetical protein